jgi:molecular chaperone DnaK (HSP70)
LGRFDLVAFACAAGHAPIEVTFDIDANGIVNVSARIRARQEQKKSALNPPPVCAGGIDKMGTAPKRMSTRKEKKELVGRAIGPIRPSILLRKPCARTGLNFRPMTQEISRMRWSAEAAAQPSRQKYHQKIEDLLRTSY